MLIKDSQEKPPFMAGDQSLLCELLHPGRDTDINIRLSIAQALVAPGYSTRLHALLDSALPTAAAVIWSFYVSWTLPGVKRMRRSGEGPTNNLVFE